MRGSTPAPGPEHVRVGGHTSCVAVWPDDAVVPSLVLDAGTGVRQVSDLLDGAAFRGTILLTHLHWDHTQGLPFFSGGDRDDADVRVVLPVEYGTEPLAALGRAMSPPSFPIGPDGLGGRWRFERVPDAPFESEGVEVTARRISHKGGITVGYRLAHAGAVVAYLPDHDPGNASEVELAAALDLALGADVLIHDAQFVAGEERIARAYGHSTVDEAIELATTAGVGRLVLFHHAPARTDDELETIELAARRSGVDVCLAREGDELTVEPR